MAYTKKTWVDVPDPSSPPAIPEGQDSLARFDAENMNRIENGIDKVAADFDSHSVSKTMHNNASTGGAIGEYSSAVGGGAVGYNAHATAGGAVGGNAKTANGGAIGYNAQTIDSSGNAIDAVQLGTGTNKTPKTMQVYDYQLMKADGTIPADRMPSKAPSGHGLGDITGGNYSNTFDNTFEKGCGFYQIKDPSKSPNGSDNWFPVIQVVRNKTAGEVTGAQISFLDSTGQKKDLSAWLRTATLGGYSNWFEILQSGNLSRYTAQTQIVSYVGTGLYGIDNPCSLTFDFAPKIIKFMACEHISSSGKLYQRGYEHSLSSTYNDGLMDVIVCDSLPTEFDENFSVGLADGSAFRGTAYGKKSEDGKTISWYASNIDVQCNNSGETYYFVGIG